jgi:molybdopterin biosynthesis enzyme
MLELEEALARILAVLPKPARERVPLREARGRILLEPVADVFEETRLALERALDECDLVITCGGIS